MQEIYKYQMKYYEENVHAYKEHFKGKVKWTVVVSTFRNSLSLNKFISFHFICESSYRRKGGINHTIFSSYNQIYR